MVVRVGPQNRDGKLRRRSVTYIDRFTAARLGAFGRAGRHFYDCGEVVLGWSGVKCWGSRGWR
jgi:hypothetical protein